MLTRTATLALVLFAAAAANAQTAVPAKAPAIDPANFDKAAKPCEDFYQFANGSWLALHPIPADRSRYGGFDELSDRNRDVVRRILEETSAKSDWPKGSST